MITFCGRSIESSQTQLNSAEDNHQDDTLPSYDAAMVDSDSHGGAANSNIPPFNPDIYDESEIEDPTLPPPPTYDEVTKSEDYQIPAST